MDIKNNILTIFINKDYETASHVHQTKEEVKQSEPWKETDTNVRGSPPLGATSTNRSISIKPFNQSYKIKVVILHPFHTISYWDKKPELGKYSYHE